MLATACWSWRCHRPISKSETHNLPEYLSAVSGLQTLPISATQLSSPWNSLFKGQRQKGFVTLAHKSLHLLIYRQCREVWQVVGSWAGWVYSKINISVRCVLEKNEEGWKEQRQNKEVKRKWYSYLPGLGPPCRLLLPAFSSPWSSWWRTVTWLPLGSRGHRRQSTSVQHVQTYQWDIKARQHSCMLAIDYNKYIKKLYLYNTFLRNKVKNK